MLRNEEDLLTYILFPKTASDFFKKREVRQEDKLSQLKQEEREKLSEIAAIAAALATYVSNTRVKAIIPARKTGKESLWTMTARQALLRQGGYVD